MSNRQQKHKEHIQAFSPFRHRMHEIIFEAETPLGKWFDIALMFLIIVSVLAVAIESLPGLSENTKHALYVLEWILTIFFTLEYVMRLYVVYRPIKYATSFYGVVDLLSIIPTYLSLFILHSNSLMIIRALRLLRVFRIFKLAAYTQSGNFLVKAIKESIPKIVFFLFFILITVCVFGSVMYLIEGGREDSAFDSIPKSIYWAIVTITTVGYGDISPTTGLGQFIASFMMIIGYAIIAVPTGIVTSEMVTGRKEPDEVQEVLAEACMYCMKEGHESDAIHCKYCGEELNPVHNRIDNKEDAL